MKVILYVSIYTIINLYLLIKFLGLITNLSEKTNKLYLKIIASIIYIICYSSVILGYLLPISTLQKHIQIFANYFTGFMIYTSIIALIIDVTKFISVKFFKVKKEFYKSKKYLYTVSTGLLAVVLLANLYGNYHAKQITVRNYNVSINKSAKDVKQLKIALIADTHLGYSVGHEMMEKMSEKINNEDVDLVVIAGDIFDNSVKTVDDIEKCKEAIASIKSKYGIYATFGNHDIDEKLFEGFSVQSNHEGYRDVEMEKFLVDAGVKILDDGVATLLDESIYLIGRKDSEKTGFGEEERESIENLLKNVDISKPTIVLEHEPRDLDYIGSLGVDLHMAGHTHAGQFFPFTIGTSIMWKNDYGQKVFNGMTSIVTSGIGVYGPNLRVLTNSEVSIVNVKFGQ